MFLLLQGVLQNNIAVHKPVPAEKLVLARWMVGLTPSTLSFVFLVNLKKYFNEVELSALEGLPLGCGDVPRDVGWLSGEGFACSLP